MSFLMGPIYYGISWIMLAWHTLFHKIGMTGSWLGTNWDWVLSIIFLVLTVRAVIFPLFVKQIRSQRAMQALQPQMKALQEKHKGDKETLQKEMVELYRREKANPLMGCLPLLIQMPIFLGVFHIIKRLGTGTSDKTLYGWTVAQFDSGAAAKLFGVSIGATFRTGGTAAVLCGILGVVMIVTTYMTSRQMILKTGWSEDPQQKMMQRLMLYGIPATLVISAVAFPLGLIIYWTVSNLFSLGQQMWVLQKYPPPKIGGAKEVKPVDPEVAKALAPKVGAKPTQPNTAAAKPAKTTPTPSQSSTKASVPSVNAATPKPAAPKTGGAKSGGGGKSGGAKRKSVKKNVG
jgi:YidC/Oxa1 family membrane protein insertase